MPHGRPAACWHRHPEAEIRTPGRPLCDDCFDWTGLALWNALAPELWRRTLGVTISRTLAHLTGTSEVEVKRLVRVRYTKVAEYQARGAVHFHAVIRLDAVPPREDPEQVAPPPAGFGADLLTEAVKAAAATVAVPYPEVDEDAAGGRRAGASSSTCATSPATGPSCRPRRRAAWEARSGIAVTRGGNRD